MRPIAPLVLALATVLLASSACTSTDRGPDALAVAESSGVPNLARPEPELLTAGQIDAEQMAALADAGVTTFISLRAPGEAGSGWEEEHAPTLGVRFVRLTIAGADDINLQKAGELHELLPAAGAGPTLLYCGSSNRVGALLALRAASIQGMEPGAALELGRAAGLTKLEPVVAERLLR